MFDVYDISSFALNFMAPVRHPKKTALNSRHRADNEKWKTIFCCGWEQKILSERWNSGVCEKRRSFKLRQFLWQKIVNLSGRNCSLQDLFPIIIVILRHFSPLTRFWFFVSAHFSPTLCCARRTFSQSRHAVLCAPKTTIRFLSISSLVHDDSFHSQAIPFLIRLALLTGEDVMKNWREGRELNSKEKIYKNSLFVHTP